LKLERRLSQNSIFVIPNPIRAPKARLLCFPYAGGSAATYSSWENAIHNDVELVIIQPPGRASRMLEEPHQNMNSIIRELLLEFEFITDVPYVLFGHSLGSRIAFELACRIKKQHGRPPSHFIASGSRAPHLSINSKKKSQSTDDQFIFELKELGGTPDEVLQNHELVQLLLPMLRADFNIAEQYQANQVQIDCPFTILSGDIDHGITKPELQAWQDLTEQDIALEYVSGGHFFIEDSRQLVIQLVNSLLEKILMPEMTGERASYIF
jgi:surfactin synthase thioesterase subunit